MSSPTHSRRRCVLEGTRAVGVEYTKGKNTHIARAARGDPLRRLDQHAPAASTLRVGAPAHLGPLGIETTHELPGVGENLQDHLEVYVQHACTQPVSMQPALKKWRRPEIGFRWLFLRSGPGATNHFEAGGFCRSNAEVDVPQPDVPLPAARDPLRRLAAGGRITATRCTSAR